MQILCVDALVVHIPQRPRPVCCVCKTEYVSTANRRRCEASSAHLTSANHPHPLRLMSPHGFFKPAQLNRELMSAVHQRLHDWWSSLRLPESIVILERIVGVSVAFPPRLICWLRQADVNSVDLADPDTITAAMSSIQIVSDAHRAMAVGGLSLWIAAQQRTQVKPDAENLFRWLMQASEGTFLRSQACEVAPKSVLDEFEWPAILAAILESSLLSSCPPGLAALLVPACSEPGVTVALRRHRRTTRGKGRPLRKYRDRWLCHDGCTVPTCVSLGAASCISNQTTSVAESAMCCSMHSHIEPRTPAPRDPKDSSGGSLTVVCLAACPACHCPECNDDEHGLSALTSACNIASDSGVLDREGSCTIPAWSPAWSPEQASEWAGALPAPLEGGPACTLALSQRRHVSGPPSAVELWDNTRCSSLEKWGLALPRVT
eukprot:jgi/Ulvmu1/7477/UM037_0020.1